MPSWGEDYGGELNDEQIEELVLMIQNVDWDLVYNEAIEANDGAYPSPPAAEAAEETAGEGTQTGEEGDGGEAAQTVELSAPGIAWSTNEITIAQGGTIKLINDGSGGQHNFIIEGYNDDAPVDMPAGSQTDWTVPSDLAPGTYTFYCAVPGHRALMEGMIAILGGQTRAVRPSMVYPAPTMNVMATPRDSARRNGRGSVLRLREILRSWTVNRDLRAAGSPPVVGNGPVPPTSPMPDAGGHTRCAWPRYRPLDDGRAQSPPLRALRRAADHKSTHDEPLAGGGLVGWGGCFFGVEAFGDP
jgi:plastocyanin